LDKRQNSSVQSFTLQYHVNYTGNFYSISILSNHFLFAKQLQTKYGHRCVFSIILMQNF